MKQETFNPIFIGGAGRSGTTLLRTMLASHSRLIGTNEFKLLPQIVDTRRLFDSFGDVMNEYQLSPEVIDQQFAQLIMGLFQPLLAMHPNQRLVEKTPHNVLATDVLLRLFPQAKMINVIRDGRDVICSLLEMEWYDANGERLWYTATVEGAANYWTQMANTALQLGNHAPFNSCYKNLHYESLAGEPEKKMRSIIKWLGEEWEDHILSSTARKQLVENEVTESSSAQVQADISTRSVGRWKNQLNKQQKRIIHEIAGEAMKSLGYIKSDDWLKK